ncbi:MAG: hypothetical protein RR576_01350 [Oscillospiraceae bacterium]
MVAIKALFESEQINNFAEFRQKDITTPEMKVAIKEWFSLYFERTVTKTDNPCQRLPYAIVNKLCKTVFSEYNSSISGAQKSVKNAWQDKNRSALDTIKKDILQWTLIGGGCLIKPIPNSRGFSFKCIRRDHYLVFARNGKGQITSIGTAEVIINGGFIYTLLERRTLDERGYLTIENKLFESKSLYELGRAVKLANIAEFAHLLPVVTYSKPFNGIGFVEVKTPMANCVDGSPDGISVYEPATLLIRGINKNERQLDREFDHGESKIFCSEDLFTSRADGTPKITDDIFYAANASMKETGITAYSPILRDANYERRKQSYLRSIETLIGFKRGILSNVEASERTATEITSSDGDYSLSIQDFQNMWFDTMRDTLKLCDTLGILFKLCDDTPFNADDISISWGNGVLYDARQEWLDRLQMVQNSLLKPELALAWKFDLPCKTEEDLEAIRVKYMPTLTDLIKGSAPRQNLDEADDVINTAKEIAGKTLNGA